MPIGLVAYTRLSNNQPDVFVVQNHESDDATTKRIKDLISEMTRTSAKMRMSAFEAMKTMEESIPIVTFYLQFDYRPPTKLLEGNVFRSCLSLCSGEGAPCDHYPKCIGPHPVRTLGPVPLLPDMGLTVQGPPASDIWWPRLDSCSNLFT